MADKRQADIVSNGPLTMLGNRRDHRHRYLLSGQGFQDLCLIHVRIVEDDRNDLLMAFDQKRSRDAGRTAAGESNFLAEGELRQPREQLILGVKFQFRGNTGRKRDLHQVHQIEIAQEAQADQTQRSRMKREGALDPVTFEQVFAAPHLFQNFSREVFSFQEKAELRFIERRIIQKREEHIRGRVVKQPGELFARGDKCALARICRLKHFRT